MTARIEEFSLLDLAIDCARRGWPVFPLRPGNKKPFPRSERCAHPPHRHGFKDATTDLETIRVWWTDHPTANIGIATGSSSGLLVVDVDPRNGGDESLGDLVAEHREWPDTPVVRTGGNGQHFLFRLPPGGVRGSKLGVGIDLKRDGGYIVGPGSVHPSGGVYWWEPGRSVLDLPIATLPQWVLAQVAKGSSTAKSLGARGRQQVEHQIDPKELIPRGERHWFLSKTAGVLRFHGVSGSDLVRVLKGVRDEHFAVDEQDAVTNDEVERVAVLAQCDIATPPKQTGRMRLIDVLLACMLLGPVPTTQAIEIATEMGLSPQTLRRALVRLKLRRIADGRRISTSGSSAGAGNWEWGLVGDVGNSGRPLADSPPGKLFFEAVRIVAEKKVAYLSEHGVPLFPKTGRYMSLPEAVHLYEVRNELWGRKQLPPRDTTWVS